MRTRFTATLAVVMALATSAAAAPTSMLQHHPKAPSSRAASNASFLSRLKNAVPSTRLPVARQKAKAATTSDPNTAQAAITAARAAEGRGDVEGARRKLHDHLSANRFDVKCLRELGHLEDRQGNLTEAELRYRQAIGADAKSSAAVNDLALCLARQGKLEPSAAAFRRAIAMRPDKALYRNNLATVLVRQGKANQAAEQLRVVYDPATAAFNVGQLLARDGRTDQAAARYREALALAPTFAPAQVALAEIAPHAVMPQTAPVVQTPVAPGSVPTVAAESLTPPPAALTYRGPTYGAPPVAAAPSTAPATPTPYVAAAPSYNAGPRYDAAQPTAAQPTTPVPTAPPAFPRLLPPVIER